MPRLLLILVSSIFLLCHSRSTDLNVVFVVLSQSNSFHELQSNALTQSLNQQAEELRLKPPVIHLLHRDWPDILGAWTILPIVANLVSLHANNASWFLFTEEFTHIHLDQLVKLLKRYDPFLDWFLGHALHDRQPTIIHHFAFHENPSEFLYPEFASGFLFSVSLLKKIAHEWKNESVRAEFSIDAKHELALFLKGSLRIRLTPIAQLCLERNRTDCATSFSVRIPQCGPPVPNGEVFFAVKTCEKFHSSRIPVVKNTWAKHAQCIGYFSDKFDSSIPTKDLKIPNTERGHCAKTFAILEHVVSHPDLQQKSWLVVADDDTIFSVYRLRQLLSCYDPSDMIALGERYGYAVTEEKHGYNYITGGGGIVLSISLARVIVENPEICTCPSNDTPDDMYLGICLKRLRIPIIHSPLFHQARPLDYPDEYLSHQDPVSFHKHWLVDPLVVYDTWFAQSDRQEHIARRLEL